MAKKKQESGPGPFMILTLVFFILASLILGVTTYMGYKGQEELETQAKEAKKNQDAARAQADEQLARRDVLRIAIGLEDPQDREELTGIAKAQSAAILEEHKRLTDKLGTSLPKGAFKWDLIADLAAGGDGSSKPSPAPVNTIPAIVKLHAKTAADWKAKFDAEKASRQTAEANAKAAQDQRDADKKSFDAKVAELDASVKTKIQAMDAAFVALKTEADKKGLEFKKIIDDWAEVRAKMEDTIKAKNDDLVAKDQKILKLQNPDPSDLDFKFKNWNPAAMTERMGTITEKSGTFVNIQFQVQMTLVPGQTFVVLPPNRSLVEVLEREKELEKRHHTHVSLGPREPFTDNELIKGMVEITDATSKSTARARITNQVQEIRNPIAKGDQLFNMSLSTGQKEHVAFAGIIDLDGDGRPDNDMFIQILERNNLIVDAYLDLKTGEIRGKKMTTATRFLIIGSDAPPVGNLAAMMKQAKELGVQLIDARLFLNLIGVKPPKNPVPPAYTSVNLGIDPTAAPKNDDAPMPPAVPDPKK
ncbi:MAG TPA: hypothetical protein VHR66_07655 [Gemmataceae bacterium]|jgi:hypothetical protein|nr:hypothetical protein [Gemmataceae bacterium]